MILPAAGFKTCYFMLFSLWLKLPPLPQDGTMWQLHLPEMMRRVANKRGFLQNIHIMSISMNMFCEHQENRIWKVDALVYASILFTVATY